MQLLRNTLQEIVSGRPAGFIQSNEHPRPDLLFRFRLSVTRLYVQHRRGQSPHRYRFSDNVRTSVLNDVEFRELTELLKADKEKTVVYDGKATGSNVAE